MSVSAIPGQRVHLSINTSKLDACVDFYRNLFGEGPVKHYNDYAKFEVENPGLNLAINLKPEGAETARGILNHVGFELRDKASVDSAIARAKSLGLPHQVEEEVTCCYGVQNKVWITDPNGIMWEFFAIKVADTGGDSSGCSITTAAGACASGESAATATAVETEVEAQAESACCAVPAGGMPKR